MTNSQRLATVRAAIANWLHAQASDRDPSSQAGIQDESIQSESILIRDELYCGRRFRAAEHHAVWFIEEDVLKLFRQANQLCEVLRGEQIDALAQTSVKDVTESSGNHHDEPNVITMVRPQSDSRDDDQAEGRDETRRAA